MPGLLPFRGIRYAAKAPVLSSLISPSDSLSAEERQALAVRHHHNVVHLLQGSERPTGAAGQESRYAQAGRRFQEWLNQGVLERDPRPAIYLLEQIFEVQGGRQLIRRGLFAAVRLHPYQDGAIVPHLTTDPILCNALQEQLEQVGADLSPILGLYSDPRGEVLQALAATMADLPIAEACAHDRVYQRLWRVEDGETIGQLQRALTARRVLIADGHHRYQAALANCAAVDRRTPGLPDDGGHRYVLMLLCSMSDPGMLIFPMHRLIETAAIDLGAFLSRLERFFSVETLPEDVHRPAGCAWAISRLAEHRGRSPAFVMVSAPDHKARILVLREDANLTEVGFPKSAHLRALDVTVLHSLIFRVLLGLSAEEEEKGVRFEKDAGAAVLRVLSGQAPLAFLLNPAPMWQVQAMGEIGETMPQKATFFYPRIPSGLLFRSIEPTGPA